MTEDEMDGITDSMDMSLSILQEMMKDRKAWHAAVHWCHKESDMIQRLNDNISIFHEAFHFEIIVL